MSKEEYLIKVNNNISDSNTQEMNQDLNTSPSKENQQNEPLLTQEKNQSIAYKKKMELLCGIKKENNPTKKKKIYVVCAFFR